MVELGHTFKVSNTKEKKEKLAVLEKKMKEYESIISKLKMNQEASIAEINKFRDEKQKLSIEISQLQEHNMQLQEQLLALE